MAGKENKDELTRLAAELEKKKKEAEKLRQERDKVRKEEADWKKVHSFLQEKCVRIIIFFIERLKLLIFL